MKKLRNKCEKIGLNFKKEISTTLVISVLLFSFAILAFIFLNNKILSLLFVGLSIINFIFFFFRVNNLETKFKSSKMNDFINYFSYFKIYVLNGESVYTAFKKTIEFSSENIQPFLERLMDEIDKDKSINPYMNFANEFDDKIVEQIMISIYEMVDNGTDTNYIGQFSNIFESFKSRISNLEEEKRNNKFDSFLNTSLIGSGLIMIILVFGIVNLVGEIL